MAVHTCSPSPGKLERWRLRIWGQCELQSKFRPSLGYPVRSISEKQSKLNVFLETQYTTMSVYLIILNCPVNCPVKMVTFMLWILATFLSHYTNRSLQSFMQFLWFSADITQKNKVISKEKLSLLGLLKCIDSLRGVWTDKYFQKFIEAEGFKFGPDGAKH